MLPSPTAPAAARSTGGYNAAMMEQDPILTLPIDRIEVVVGDITRIAADAIVNAANESLLGGGGVDGAIHRAAGPRLRQHNATLGGCPTGLAIITPSFDLEARGIRHIIHAVGPVWHAGEAGESAKLSDTREDVLLANCYQQSLELALAHGVQTLAFPAISTGAYRFPKDRAARIALGHVLGWLRGHELPAKVIFCCFDQQDAELYRQTIDTRQQWMFNRKRG
jgi:O-acetyl-ADP-ribose deacetylase